MAEVTPTKGVFRRLLGYLRPHRTLLFGAFILLAVATTADVLGPILIQQFIDKYLTPRHFPTEPLVILGGVYLFLQVMKSGFNFLQLVGFQNAALKMIQALRIEVFGKVQRLGLTFFDRTPTGVLVSRITNDTEAIKDFYVTVLSTYVKNALLLIGIFVSMFFLDFRLALFCVILAPVIVYIMMMYRKISGRVFHEARRKLSQLNAKLNESLQGMYLIQAMRQQERLRSEFGEVNGDYQKARLRNIRINSLMLRPLMDVLYLAVLVVIMSFFGIRSFHSVIDIGVLYAFVNYLERFFEPVNEMMQQLNVFQQAMVAGERVFQLLDQTLYAPTQIGSANPEIARGKVTFDDVTFSYDGETDVLKNISFTAYPGQTVALVGHTGSGKSSIVNLLMRFYPVVKGRIMVDDVPLDAYSDIELRNKIGLVLQDPFLFVGDIAQNIRLGNEHVTDAEVVEAARFVQADSFIERLVGGYQEPVRERGSTLSAGQRQLVSFARTMAIEPKILVLDEATASVDTETEEAIQTALLKMRRGRTTIAIAHRLSTIQDADLILVLHHGEIVERGTHQELLAHRGLYHKMYLLQQGGREAVQL
ncbi:ABC transporter ATP-binding protein [Alicyclobacillus ferrooxydans]|uniref:Multidrug ABC transporter ATP-binding protein n=1 Tax=Alicyclobacillus ferrooxydans TaxID=471514 RepID=A0A0P9EKP8_9BACL|nr:ABC transporter transmembrane domain-containing protein [Alicyclobacillus ferrooxydans]KPV43735.1 multidrug ABC transporter ATP-binding protein [Alicyclobacillus ferrooxydans]